MRKFLANTDFKNASYLFYVIKTCIWNTLSHILCNLCVFVFLFSPSSMCFPGPQAWLKVPLSTKWPSRPQILFYVVRYHNWLKYIFFSLDCYNLTMGMVFFAYRIILFIIYLLWACLWYLKLGLKEYNQVPTEHSSNSTVLELRSFHCLILILFHFLAPCSWYLPL